MNREIDAMVETTKQLSLAVEAIKRQAGAVTQEFQQACQMLEQTAARTRNDVSQIAQSVGNQVAHAAQQGVESTLEKSAAKYDQAANGVGARLERSTTVFEQAAQVVSANAHRKLLMGYASIIGTALLLFVGGGLLLRHYDQAIEDAHAEANAAQVSAELATAFSQIGVTSCGGQPCIKLDAKSPRWGGKGEYVLLETNRKSDK